MPTTPAWESPRNGLPGNQGAVAHAGHVMQLLGTHGVSCCYKGAVTIAPGGGTQFQWLGLGNADDVSQPFEQPTGSTTIGRVTLPVRPTGAGADLYVSLCNDDGNGNPVTAQPLASTMVPKEWITALAAPDGLENATGPLAIGDYNVLYGTGSINTAAWAAPAGDASGTAANATLAVSGDYIIFLGGYTSAPIATVSTAQYQGAHTLALPQPQPPLPTPSYWGGAAVTTDSVVYLGGLTTHALSAVWVASWDANAGVIGSWSSQTPLPTPLSEIGAAAWGDTIYVIGGSDGISNVYNAVYYNTSSNGQLGAWQTAPALSTAIRMPMVAVIGSWLVVTGGSTTTGTTPNSQTWYARINADGSLNDWLGGPPLPTPCTAYSPGWDCAVTDQQMILVCGGTGPGTGTDQIQILSVTDNDIAPTWKCTNWRESGVEAVAAFPVGAGQWEIINPIVASSIYSYTTLTPVPTISVPLPATGLTPENLYHIVLQQHQSISASDYLAYGFLDDTPLTYNLLQSPRHAGTWTAITPGWGMPMTVYDTTETGHLIHTWEDPTATGSTYDSQHATRATTLIYDYQGAPLGVCEATRLSNAPLNSNPTFTTGISPWTAVNGTITQSTTQTQGGLAYSGLLTPTGGNPIAYATSELVPISIGLPVLGNVSWLTANGWLYTPTTWPTVSLSVNWFDRAQNYLSTSSNTTTLTGAAWKNVACYFLAPATAAYAAIVPTLGGTPAPSNTLYLSDVRLAYSPETVPVLGDVAAITYDTTGRPTGITQVA